MKTTRCHIAIVLSSLLVFVVGLLSCTGVESPDQRLVSADSLMERNPAKAYEVLKAVNADSLRGDENRAYYALLYTEAKYKNYEKLTSDSLISTAVNYYSNLDNHSDRHMQALHTRALIYKGAALEDMGNYIEAIKHYKRAEDNADTTDLLGLAYSNFRLAVVYYNKFAGSVVVIRKCEKARHYFRLLGDSLRVANTLLKSGTTYTSFDTETGVKDLLQSAKLYLMVGDSTSHFSALEGIARAAIIDSNYRKAIEIDRQIIKKMPGFKRIDNCYYDLCYAYSGLGMADSANLFFSKTDPNPLDKQQLSTRYWSESALAYANKDFDRYHRLDRLRRVINDSIFNNKVKTEMMNAESAFMENTIAAEKLAQERLKTRAVALAALLLALAAASVAYALFKRYKTKRDIRELKRAMQLESDEKYDNLKKKFSALLQTAGNSKNGQDHKNVTEILLFFIQEMKTLMNCSRDTNDKSFTAKARKIADEFKDTKNLLEVLRSFANSSFDNNIDKAARMHRELNNRDIDMITLLFCGFDYTDISLLMGMSPDAVSVTLTRIKDKMKLEVPLTKHIALITGHKAGAEKTKNKGMNLKKLAEALERE